MEFCLIIAVNVVKLANKMEILYQQLSKESEYCINLLEVELPEFEVPWHYHPEVEILYIEKSNGLRFVGDHSEPFAEGDIAIIGANLPHVWKNNANDHFQPDAFSRALVVHFQEQLFAGNLAFLPEMGRVNQLLVESQCGIKFYGSSQIHLAKMIKRLMPQSGMQKLLSLLEILDYMSSTTEKQVLASSGYSKIRTSADFDRFDKAHRYMIENFQQSITLNEVANLVGMTPSSFCRYFKKRTTKSFLTFLNEIRIGHACKLLLENKMNIAGVCYECGFHNVSNFNQIFKNIKGTTPGMYVKKLRC
jgi:AraC-like DNA-binding protein